MYGSTDYERGGWLPRQWERLWGKRDPIASQLAEMAKQGAGMARVAHVCAFVMLVLFSLGSLVGIAGASFAAVQASWAAGRLDLIHVIPTGVSGALVLCMDIAALYAALMLRLHAARRSRMRERWLHIAVIVAADILEAATFAYMSYAYDLPSSAIVWALIVARAIAAPLFAVYLSLAQPLPIGPREMLYIAEMGAGKGMLDDIGAIVRDASAPLAQKMQLFSAAAIMQGSDRDRLERMIGAASPAPATLERAPFYAPGVVPGLNGWFPTGGGTPGAMPAPDYRPASPSGRVQYAPVYLERGSSLEAAAEARTAGRPAMLRLEDPDKPARKPRKASSTGGKGKRKAAPRRSDADISADIRTYADNYAMGHGGALPSNQSIARACGVSVSTASKWRGILEAEAAEIPAAEVAAPIAR